MSLILQGFRKGSLGATHNDVEHVLGEIGRAMVKKTQQENKIG
jgi:hypothetical protein